jgi:hypothetical protein
MGGTEVIPDRTPTFDFEPFRREADDSIDLIAAWASLRWPKHGGDGQARGAQFLVAIDSLQPLRSRQAAATAIAMAQALESL